MTSIIDKSFREEAQTVSSYCLYGQEDRRNRVLFEYHFFSFVCAISFCLLLLRSSKLSKIYRPLSIIVNIAIILGMLSDLLYFSYFPYAESQGNCSEIFVRRLYFLLIMFGELHQVYFIASVLGFLRYRFNLYGVISFSLESLLQASVLCLIVSLVSSFFVTQLFMIGDHLWALFVIFLQIYFILSARTRGGRRTDEQEDGIETGIIDPNNDGITIFETLTYLQIIPTTIAMTDRILEMCGLNYYGSLDGVMMILEGLTVYLFYIKILILQEKGNAVRVTIS
jgi:hypothetical protein